MSDEPTTEQFRQELERKVATLLRETLREQHGDSQPDFEDVERLAKLLDLSERTAPRPPNRLRLPRLLLAALVILLFLAVVPVHRTKVILDLRVSGFAARLSEDRSQELTEGMELNSLELAAKDGRIEVPPAENEQHRRIAARELPADRDRNLHLQLTATSGSAEPGKRRSGVIVLKPLVAATGSTFELGHAGRGSRLFIRWQPVAPTEPMPITLKGWVTAPGEVALDGGIGEALLLEHQPPKGIRVDLVDPTAARWTLEPIGSIPFRLPLLVSAVRFEGEGKTFPTLTPDSTIRSGNLRLASIDGAVRALREGEGLRIEAASKPMAITALAVDDREIALRLEGEVRHLETDLGGQRQSHMPTLLTWIRGNPTLSLLWSAMLFLFGLVTGISRWWRTGN